MPRCKGRKRMRRNPKQTNPKQNVDEGGEDVVRDGRVTRTLGREEEDRRAGDHPDDRLHPQIPRRTTAGRTTMIRRNQNRAPTTTTEHWLAATRMARWPRRRRHRRQMP